jgi:3-phosphoshikimate 1-carboxyvinyltransferase
VTTPRQIAFSPCRRVEGQLRVPGDKGISHRALIVGAVGHGAMQIDGLAPGADVASSLAAVRALGVAVETGRREDSALPAGSSRGSGSHVGSGAQGEVEGTLLEGLDFQILVNGLGLNGIKTPETPIHVGNSGTTIRLLAGVLAGSDISTSLDGDESIRRRPMRRVAEPLRAMGADIAGADDEDRAPLAVGGRPLTGADHRLAIASAQVKSALLLAGLHASGETSVTEPSRSRDHTERMLKYLGVQIEESSNRLIVKSTRIQNASLTIPGDLSSAAFLLVAAAIVPGSRIVIEGVGVNPTRTGILDVLGAYGAEIEIRDEQVRCGEPVATVEVRAGARRGVVVEGDLTVRAIDELPLVALLGACADEGVTEIRDAAELRVKESDRISTTERMLRSMGAGVRATPDGLVVEAGGKLTGATIDPAGDHRIAMTAAVGALAADGATTILGWDCVEVSYPGFERVLESVTVR